MRLHAYDNGSFVRGRSKWVEMMWLIAQALFVRSQIPGSAHRRLILRIFGASIANDVEIKPGVRIKFPWRLVVGAHSWIGEDVWIDNLAEVTIGSQCCISQGAYLCTGSHDWTRQTFDLITRPIHVADQAWIAARSIIGPGVSVGEGSVLSLGSVATKNLAPWTIYAGTPAAIVKTRLPKADIEDR